MKIMHILDTAESSLFVNPLEIRIRLSPWRHILSSLHILSPATIHAGTLGTYCCLEYILSPASVYILITILFSRYMRRQNIPLTLKQIVAANSTDMEIKYKIMSLLSLLIEDFWVNLNQIWFKAYIG